MSKEGICCQPKGLWKMWPLMTESIDIDKAVGLEKGNVAGDILFKVIDQECFANPSRT